MLDDLFLSEVASAINHEAGGEHLHEADAARERELFRYFDPPETEADAQEEASLQDASTATEYAHTAKTPSPLETTLTALAHLCALQLDVQRAAVRSVIPREWIKPLTEYRF